MRLITTSTTHHFSKVFASKVDHLHFQTYPSGELYAGKIKNYQGEKIIILHATPRETLHRSFFELFFILEVLEAQGVASITIIFTYLAYLRQDHIDYHPHPLDVLEKILSRFKHLKIYVVDPHTDVQQWGMMPLSLENFYAEKIQKIAPDALIVAPDKGRHSMVGHLSKNFDLEALLLNKVRGSSISFTPCTNMKSVEGRHCIILDDIIDSGDTLSVVSL